MLSVHRNRVSFSSCQLIVRDRFIDMMAAGAGWLVITSRNYLVWDQDAALLPSVGNIHWMMRGCRADMSSLSVLSLSSQPVTTTTMHASSLSLLTSWPSRECVAEQWSTAPYAGASWKYLHVKSVPRNVSLTPLLHVLHSNSCNRCSTHSIKPSADYFLTFHCLIWK